MLMLPQLHPREPVGDVVHSDHPVRGVGARPRLVGVDSKGPYPAVRKLLSGRYGGGDPCLRVCTLRSWPEVKPLTLVLKQFMAERSLDKPYLGGLSSHGLFLLVTRFLQAQHTHAMDDLGALLVSLLDFYAHRFDPRTVGVAVARNAGEGECVLDT